MPRTVRCGLIQARNVLPPDRELPAIKKAMIDRHVTVSYTHLTLPTNREV